MINKINLVAASAVALVVLVDLATGQGPPIYTNYLQQQENFRPPPQPVRPVAYVHRAEYDPKKIDKEYEKAIELGKVDPHHHNKAGLKKSEYAVADAGKEYEKEDKKATEEEASPGMFSSLTNRMSGAWKSISPFSRSKRSANEAKTNSTNELPPSQTTKVIDASKPAQSARSVEATGVSATTASLPASTGRGIDNYEYLQYKNQGYIYFKVPKHLVCGSH